MKLDDMILSFRDSIKARPVIDIAKINRCKEYRKSILKNFTDTKPFVSSLKGVPAHVKASVNYNDLITYFNQQNKGKIRSGDKIKMGILKKIIPYGIESCAFKGYDDPAQIIDFIAQYINYEKIFQE